MWRVGSVRRRGAVFPYRPSSKVRNPFFVRLCDADQRANGGSVFVAHGDELTDGFGQLTDLPGQFADLAIVRFNGLHQKLNSFVYSHPDFILRPCGYGVSRRVIGDCGGLPAIPARVGNHRAPGHPGTRGETDGSISIFHCPWDIAYSLSNDSGFWQDRAPELLYTGILT